MANKYLKKFFIVLFNYKNAYQTNVEISSSTIKMTKLKINKTTNNKSWKDCGQWGTLIPC